VIILVVALAFFVAKKSGWTTAQGWSMSFSIWPDGDRYGEIVIVSSRWLLLPGLFGLIG
jgi:hypothetical protein